jgi:hypothetical protein
LWAARKSAVAVDEERKDVHEGVVVERVEMARRNSVARVRVEGTEAARDVLRVGGK